MCTQHIEEQGLFSGSPVAHWWVKGWGVGHFRRLRHTGLVVPYGRDMGGEVLSEVGVGLKSGSPCLCLYLYLA